mmetsp:Transcript_14121/g.30676  ORF Transcript_14121/g.30676 Transcript_14121/m.30676 type:complete len:211 (-) Transcript_14121:188-820(-)
MPDVLWDGACQLCIESLLGGIVEEIHELAKLESGSDTASFVGQEFVKDQVRHHEFLSPMSLLFPRLAVPSGCFPFRCLLIVAVRAGTFRAGCLCVRVEAWWGSLCEVHNTSSTLTPLLKLLVRYCFRYRSTTRFSEDPIQELLDREVVALVGICAIEEPVSTFIVPLLAVDDLEERCKLLACDFPIAICVVFLEHFLDLNSVGHAHLCSR